MKATGPEDLVVDRLLMVEPVGDRVDELLGHLRRQLGLAAIVERVYHARLDRLAVLLERLEVRPLHHRRVHVDEARIDGLDGRGLIALHECGRLLRLGFDEERQCDLLSHDVASVVSTPVVSRQRLARTIGVPRT